MKLINFAYWLQGAFELGKIKQLDESQTEIVKKHLNMVFEHDIDPSFPDLEVLQEIHNPSTNEEPLQKETSNVLPKPVPKGFSSNYSHGRNLPRRIMC